MEDGSDRVSHASDFMSHGHCYFWQEDLLWLHVGSDSVVALAYFSIPLALLYFIQKRPEANLRGIFGLFAAFILLCGATHLFAVVTVWEPYYYLSGFTKAATATISAVTAVALWFLMPLALQIPAPAQLQAANDELLLENKQRKKAEAQLRELNAKLEAKVQQRTEELEQFVYAASHDLQQPLRQLNAYAQFLGSDLGNNLSSDASEDLHFIRQASTHMSSLVDSLLELSRTNQEPLHTESMPVHQCIRAALENLESAITETGARIGPPPEGTIKGDATLLTTLYQNLISNALKYARDIPIIEFTCEQGDGEVILGVRDFGVGLPQDKANKAFDPFVRLHNNSEIQGSGIGLSIARRVVERHGGHIWAEYTPEAGTHFRFTLPNEREDHDEQ